MFGLDESNVGKYYLGYLDETNMPWVYTGIHEDRMVISNKDKPKLFNDLSSIDDERTKITDEYKLKYHLDIFHIKENTPKGLDITLIKTNTAKH